MASSSRLPKRRKVDSKQPSVFSMFSPVVCGLSDFDKENIRPQDVPQSEAVCDPQPELPTPPLPDPESQASGFPQKRFPKIWLLKYPWIGYDEIDGSMFCKLCRKHKKPRPLSSGTRNYR